MAKIQSCPKTLIKNSEWLTFCITIRDEINSANRDITVFKPQFTAFNDSIIQFDNSLNRISKSQYTKVMKEIKYRLNTSRTGLFKKVEAELSSSHSDMANAATVLKIITDKYRNISHLTSEAIIGRTEGIVELFESDEYKGYVTQLNLTDRVAQLKKINNEAKQLLSKKITESGNRSMIRKTTITRRELHNAYDALVDEINFIARRDGYADYQSLFIFWNSLIDKARVSISSRNTLARGGKSSSGSYNPVIPPSGGDDDDHPVIE